MYASNAVSSNNISNTSKAQHIPVETYENRAVIDELSRRCENSTQSKNRTESNCSAEDKPNNCTCNNHIIQTSNCKDTHLLQKLSGKFGIDDAIIILLMILLLTDGNDSNDIMLPLLLAVLLFN